MTRFLAEFSRDASLVQVNDICMGNLSRSGNNHEKKLISETEIRPFISKLTVEHQQLTLY
jgi:hypothetical protein